MLERGMRGDTQTHRQIGSNVDYNASLPIQATYRTKTGSLEWVWQVSLLTPAVRRIFIGDFYFSKIIYRQHVIMIRAINTPLPKTQSSKRILISNKDNFSFKVKAVPVQAMKTEVQLHSF